MIKVDFASRNIEKIRLVCQGKMGNNKSVLALGQVTETCKYCMFKRKDLYGKKDRQTG